MYFNWYSEFYHSNSSCLTVVLQWNWDLFVTCYLSLIGRSFFLYFTRLNWQTIYNRPVKGRRQDSISKENSLFTDNANCLAFLLYSLQKVRCISRLTIWRSASFQFTLLNTIWYEWQFRVDNSNLRRFSYYYVEKCWIWTIAVTRCCIAKQIFTTPSPRAICTRTNLILFLSSPISL